MHFCLDTIVCTDQKRFMTQTRNAMALLTYYRSFGKQVHELIALKQKVERRFSHILLFWMGFSWMAKA